MLHQLTGTASGSAAPLSPTSQRAAWVMIDCAAGAGGPIYIGGPNVSVSNGIPIAAGQVTTLPTIGQSDPYNLNSIYVIGTAGVPYNVLYFVL